MSVVATQGVSSESKLASRLDLIVSPVFAVVLAMVGLAVWFYSDMDSTTLAILSPDKLRAQLAQPLVLRPRSLSLFLLRCRALGTVNPHGRGNLTVATHCPCAALAEHIALARGMAVAVIVATARRGRH